MRAKLNGRAKKWTWFAIMLIILKEVRETRKIIIKNCTKIEITS